MSVIPILPPPQHTPNLPDYVRADAQLREAAVKLEATFLAEMLKSAGLGARGDGMTGGVGEDQFTSFLTQAQAQEMAEAGGIGLAEALFEAMKVRTHDG